MGKQNRVRRAAKKRRDADRRRSRSRSHGHASPPPRASRESPPPRPPPQPTAQEVVVAAVGALRSRHPSAGALLEQAGACGAPAGAVVALLLDAALADVWERGWCPEDVARASGHVLSDRHRAVATAAVWADGRRRDARRQPLHPAWRRQLDGMAVPRALFGDDEAVVLVAPDDVVAGIEVLDLLGRVPDLPPTVPAPGSAEHAGVHVPDGLDLKLLDRVRALLAKAESTEFDHEAELLTAKAQELIARHAIADALLHRQPRGATPSTRRVPVPDPYAQPKAVLLSLIGDANRCRSVYDRGLGWSTLVGYDADLDATELLFASLLTQATTAVARLGSRRDTNGRSRTASFRRSFLIGFAARIGQRLQDTTADQVSSSDARSHGELLPVLAARDARVADAYEAAFPNVHTFRTRSGNADGYVAGTAAADAAVLDPGAALTDRGPGQASPGLSG